MHVTEVHHEIDRVSAGAAGHDDHPRVRRVRLVAAEPGLSEQTIRVARAEGRPLFLPHRKDPLVAAGWELQRIKRRRAPEPAGPRGGPSAVFLTVALIPKGRVRQP